MGFPPEVTTLREKVRNWGRWGDDDQIGTMNLVTDEVVKPRGRHEIQDRAAVLLGDAARPGRAADRGTSGREQPASCR